MLAQRKCAEMGIIMYFLVVCLLIMFILSFRYSKSNGVFVYNLFVLGMMYSMVYGNADTDGYKMEYEHCLRKKIFSAFDEPLWDILQIFFRKMHFSFEAFRFVLFIICIFLICSTVSKITEEKNIILSLYFVFPFIIDMAQMRNFVASSLVVFGFQFLFREEKKYRLYFTACVLASGFIHTVMWGYLILLLVCFIDLRVILYSIMGIMAFCFLNMKIIPVIVTRLYSNIKGHFLIKYIERGTISNRGIIIVGIYFFFLAAFSLLVWYSRTRLTECNGESYLRINIIAKSCLVLSMSYILVWFSMDFIRIFRNFTIIFFAFFWEETRNIKYQLLLRFLIVVLAIISCYLFICWDFTDTVFLPAFQNNYFFNWFIFS